MATSTTVLTNSIRLARLVRSCFIKKNAPRFARRSTKFMVNHHSGHHGGKRYEVHDDKTHQIPVAVKEGREKIELWMRKSISDVDEASIKSLMLAEQGPPYRDVPDF